MSAVLIHMGAEQKANNIIIYRLTALWAFAEGGLGGLLHLLHIPLTGFLVGGFAVIINVLLAKYSHYKSLIFLRALMMVLGVKFLLSPYTPFGAYIAVGFQGILAALVFPALGVNRFSVTLFSLSVMLESALQKPLVAYFIFGKKFWQSVTGVLSDALGFSRENLVPALLIVFVLYLLIYIGWAFVLSGWSVALYKGAGQFPIPGFTRSQIKIKLNQEKEDNSNQKKSRSMMYLTAVAGFVAGLIFSSENLPLIYSLRTLLLLFFLFVVLPRIGKKALSFFAAKNKNALQSFAHEIPSIRQRTKLAWVLAHERKGLKKIKAFISYTIWLNVFYEPAA